MCCMGFLKCGIILVLSVVAFGGGFYAGWWARDYKNSSKNKSPPAPKANSTTTKQSSSNSLLDLQSQSRKGIRDMPSFYHYDRHKSTDADRDVGSTKTLGDVVDFSSSEWYRIEQDSLELTLDVTRGFLKAINQSLQVDTSPLLPFAADLPMYFRSRSHDVMRVLRQYAESGGKLPELSQQQQADLQQRLRAVGTVEALVEWVNEPMKAHEAILAPQAQLQASHLEAAKAAFQAANPDVLLPTLSVLDPAQQIVNHAERMRTSTSHRRSKHRRSLAGTLERTESRCIGVVVHVLQYSDSQGYRAPLNAYSRGDVPFQTLLQHVNRAYQIDSLPVQLYLHEYRSDVTQHPYLLLSDLAHWQHCLRSNKSCLEGLAQEHNEDVDEYINIYTLGSSTLCEGCCQGCPWGYSSVTVTQPGTADLASAYIALQWDVVDPAVGNNDGAYQLGAVTLIQELGHYLGGLLHTHQGGCKEGDLVPDTPAETPMYDSAWFAQLKAWCVEQRQLGDLEGLLPGSSSRETRLSALSTFKSCPDGGPYIDNVMNLMSYAPRECRVLLTLGQVQQFMSVLWYTRPQLLANSMCYSSA